MTGAGEENELVARFIFDGSKIRANGTPKPECFLPNPQNMTTSVTRHDGLTEADLWKIGFDVGQQGGRAVKGRSDVAVHVIWSEALAIEPDPTPSNPNHANIVAWPSEKHQQKRIAQAIALRASNVSRPPE